MTPRRLLLLATAAAVVLNRRRIKAAVIRWTGTNVHTEKARSTAS
jgi:hypothetical protein